MNIPDNSIVRIYDSSDRVVGSGFLVSSTLIMTCAHVVQAASGSTNVGTTVALDFPLAGHRKKILSRIIFLYASKDIASLEISEPLPDDVTPAHSVIADNLWGHTFRAFGFPQGYENGVWVSGVLRGHTGEGWLQIEGVSETGYGAQPGFSGGPVWDDQLRAVVGMIVATEMDRAVKAAFCIPVRSLINVYPLLKDYSTILCPYRSLDVFTENDDDLFFGRKRLVGKLISSLKRELRFLAIVGPSGSGKSSLVRAGLIPELKAGKVPGSTRWHMMTIRPGAQPFAQLENVGLINIDKDLETSVNSWLARNPSKTRLLIFIDQFEELLIVTPRDIRKLFISEVLKLLNSSLPVTVVITLRSDFSNRFFEEAAVLASDWLQLGLVSIPPFLDIDELQEMIINPAEKIGVKFERGLVDRIIRDAIDLDHAKEQAETTILPLLEFSLTQMWEVKQDNMISHDNYQKVGGVSGGLSLWADRAYYDLKDEERRVARRILTDLINFGDDILHIPNTKRIRKYEVIARNELAQDVIQKMVQARLLVAGYDISLRQNTVEIIHEALIYRWALLSRWIEEDREYLRIYNHFAENARDWERLGKEDGLLYRGTRLSGLVQALENRKDEVLSSIELEFLETSKQYEKLIEQILSARKKISPHIDVNQVFESTMRLINEAIGAEQGTLLVFVPEENKLQYQVGYNFLSKELHGTAIDITLRAGEGLAGLIFRHREILVMNDLQAEPLWTRISPASFVFRSAIAAPLSLESDLIGVLLIFHHNENFFGTDSLGIVKAIADQTAGLLHNAKLYAENENLTRELEQTVMERTTQFQREQQNTETLLRILTELSSSLDLDRALNRTLALLNDSVGAEQGTIMLLNAEDNLLHYRAGYGHVTDKAPGEGRGFRLKIGEGLAGWSVEHRDSALINDLLSDSRWVRTNTSSEYRSAIVVPLLVAEDVIGVLMVFHRKPNFFSAELLSMVKAIAGQMAVSINNAHLYELIRDQAERLGSMLRREQEDASRSQAILEAVADGVLVTGANNRISFINQSAAQILDLEPGRVIGQSLEVFGGLFGKSAGTWMETIRNWSKDPVGYEPGESFAEQLDLENGRIVLVHLAPVIFQNDFLGTVSIFRDITHEVEVDRLKSEFVATVKHEFRAPMTLVRGAVDVLLMGAAGPLDERQEHFLTVIKSNTEILNILIDDMLDISRIESGRATLSFQGFDIRKIAQEVINDTLRFLENENKRMEISLVAPEKVLLVYGDTERVRQILDNLIDNAYRYTPENGMITVRIHSRNSDEVQVDVKDNGIGVPLDDQNRIFERFYRGEHPLVMATPGTGLGLSIARQLVEMHKGRIWVKSTGIPGDGSTFSFTVPVNKSA